MVVSAAEFLAFIVILGFNLSPVLADDKNCSIARDGTVTMFTGETLNVSLPCKSRLADIRCGDYRVQLTPGSAANSDDSPLFSPNTLYVKVVNLLTGNELEIRTSLRYIRKFKSGATSNPWVRRDGSLDVVETADYDSTLGAAVVRTGGVFSVEFSDTEQRVVLTCSHDTIASPGLPDTLCGDGTTSNALDSVRSTLFPNNTNIEAKAAVHFMVLNHPNVVQSKTCNKIVSKFRLCADKQGAVERCHVILGQSPQAQCLAGSRTPLEDFYLSCLTSVCDDDDTALDDMNLFIGDNCDAPPVGVEAESEMSCLTNDSQNWPNRACNAILPCPDIANIECYLGEQCGCTPGFFYSQGTGCCVDPCDQLYSTDDADDGFVLYIGTIFQCGDGGLLGMMETEDPTACLETCMKNDDCVFVAYNFTQRPFQCTFCAFGNPVTLGISGFEYSVRKCV